jgi:hypothetical protein
MQGAKMLRCGSWSITIVCHLLLEAIFHIAPENINNIIENMDVYMAGPFPASCQGPQANIMFASCERRILPIPTSRYRSAAFYFITKRRCGKKRRPFSPRFS